MSKGDTLTYWRDSPPKDDAEMVGLFVKFDQWLFVGIYTKEKLESILRTTYAAYPKDSIKKVFLP